MLIPYAFGKTAEIVGMTFDPAHPNVQALKKKHPQNWRQVMAESQGLRDVNKVKEKTAMNLFEFGAKVAQSSCSPCDMPNGPANKKHMTGASPAVTEAGEHSEELGTPEVAETEHSDAKAKMPEEGVKSAYAFGYMLGR